ncbi:MAG: hypothetical protein J5J06_00530 [Phycisphaerae bacterium]|nr:hypothetical protein [Phycisphaerae bacterium]
MMKTRMIRSLGLGVMTSAAVVLAAGCPSLLPTVPVVVNLTDAGAGTYDVVAGTPVQRSAQFTGEESPVTITRGTVQLDPSVVTYAMGGGPAKGLAGAQAIETCQQACALAGVDGALCDDVCTDGQISVRVWVGAFDEVETVCTTGDEYGPFLVALENGVPSSVDPSSVTLSSNTVTLLNGGNFSVCVEVIAPEDGQVIIDSLRFDVGL